MARTPSPTVKKAVHRDTRPRPAKMKPATVPVKPAPPSYYRQMVALRESQKLSPSEQAARERKREARRRAVEKSITRSVIVEKGKKRIALILPPGWQRCKVHLSTDQRSLVITR